MPGKTPAPGLAASPPCRVLGLDQNRMHRKASTPSHKAVLTPRANQSHLCQPDTLTPSPGPRMLPCRPLGKSPLAVQVVTPGELAVQGCGPVVREPHSQVVQRPPPNPRGVWFLEDSRPSALQNPASKAGVTWGTAEGPGQGIPFKGLEARTLNFSRVPPYQDCSVFGSSSTTPPWR